MSRCFDVVLSLIGLVLGLPLFVVLYVIGLLDTGSPVFCQQRVGRNRKAFRLVKFRTMRKGTEDVATHLVSASSVTPFGGFLRRTKLDELPQLWNVLKGDMSLVGPRPCLYNQEDLIADREAREVFDVRPGVTGFAQINNIDMSTPELLAETDAEMLQNMSVGRYLYCIFATLCGKGFGDRIGAYVGRGQLDVAGMDRDATNGIVHGFAEYDVVSATDADLEVVGSFRTAGSHAEPESRARAA